MAHNLSSYRSAPWLRSPGAVQLSTAAAITLGLLPGRMFRTDCTHCLNLLLTYPEGCRANCAYCGLARHREEARDYAARNFIRVDWPVYPYRDILELVRRGRDHGQFQRMCLSMITHPRAVDDTRHLLAQWVETLPHIPVSILSNPTSMSRDDLVALKRDGGEIFTVALDAVTPAIFDRTRGRGVEGPHRWNDYWQALEWAAEIFGAEKFGAHLICGLGESELELLTVAQRVKDLGGNNHLFAFFPEKGSLMAQWPAVAHGQWRRVQLARFLIDYGEVRVEQMHFDSTGRTTSFGIASDRLEQLIDDGRPFQTSGCPGDGDAQVSACDRPFGDSPPSDIKSFPFSLGAADIKLVRKQFIDK